MVGAEVEIEGCRWLEMKQGLSRVRGPYNYPLFQTSINLMLGARWEG